MSDGDSFIQEVSEELRRDRMNALWRRWGPFVIGGAVALVVASAAATWFDHRATEAAQARGGALLDAAGAEDPAAAFAEVAAGAEAGSGVALVARLSRAGALAASGATGEAADLYDAIAAEDGAEPVYRALAAFKAVMLREAGMTPEARIDALAPHAAEGAPFRPLALERRAVARLAAGDRAGASEDALALLSEPMASPLLRERAARLADLAAVGAGAAPDPAR